VESDSCVSCNAGCALPSPQCNWVTDGRHHESWPPCSGEAPIWHGCGLTSDCTANAIGMHVSGIEDIVPKHASHARTVAHFQVQLTKGAARIPAAKYDSIMMVKGLASLQQQQRRRQH